MKDIISNNRILLLLSGVTLITTTWCVLTGGKDPSARDSFLVAVTIFELYAGALGVYRVNRLKVGNKALRRALKLISYGIFTWGLGTFVWDIYVFMGTDVPYPSLADLFYGQISILWTIGVYHLVTALGVENETDKDINPFLLSFGVLFAWIIPFLLYALLAEGGQLTPVASFEYGLNVYYVAAAAFPVAEAAMIYFLTHRKNQSSIVIALRLLIIGFVLQFVGDFLFALRTGNDTYYNGGPADIGYFISHTFVALAVYGLTPKNLPTESQRAVAQTQPAVSASPVTT